MKDFKGLKDLLAAAPSLGLDDLQARWQNYLNSTEKFTRDRGGSLAHFCKNADSFIQGPLFERTKGGSNGRQSSSDLAIQNARALGLERVN